MATGRHIMRAVRVFEFGGPEVLKLQGDTPLPNLKENQVLIKVHVCGVNPVDTYIRSGTYTRKPSLPYTPGLDVSGVITEVGGNVTSFKKGDRVFTHNTVSGGYADYAVASVDSVFPLSDKLDFKQGAAIGIPYFTAYHALFQNQFCPSTSRWTCLTPSCLPSQILYTVYSGEFSDQVPVILEASGKRSRGSAKAGETVLIHGASGGVGIAASQIARAYGLKVLGTAGTEEGMDLIKKNGAHLVFNHRDMNYMTHLKNLADHHNIDVIIEMLANVNLANDLKLLGNKGRVMIVGCRGLIEINPRETMAKETSIRGVSLFSASKEEIRECAAAVLAGIEVGWLKPVIGREYPLEKVAEAHRNLIENQGALGKMVLLV